MHWRPCQKHSASVTEMERAQDAFLGLLFVGLGLAAAWLARSYSGAGGTYPMVLGVLLAVFGGVVAIRGLRATTNERRVLVDAPPNLIIALIACTAYVALVIPLGFYTASVALMLTLPVALGFRRPVYLSVMALAFIAIVWVLFSVVLEKPLPAEIWSSARMGAV